MLDSHIRQEEKGDYGDKEIVNANKQRLDAANKVIERAKKDTTFKEKVISEIIKNNKWEDSEESIRTVHESIAESLRLFILNPDLLKNIAPNRYQYFIDKGLKPTVTKKMGEVLHDAPKEYFEQVEKQSKKI